MDTPEVDYLEDIFAGIRDQTLENMRLALDTEAEILRAECDGHLGSLLPDPIISADTHRLSQLELQQKIFDQLDSQPRFQTTQSQQN